MNQETKPKYRSTTADERYYHFRFENQPQTGVAKKIRSLSAVTAFARQDKEGNWFVSYAECDSRDQFCRRTGRNVARRKWFAGKRSSISEPSFDNCLGSYSA